MATPGSRFLGPGSGIADPGYLRDQLVEGGEREGGVGGEPGRVIAREGRQAGVADEEDVEVLREVLVAGRRPTVAHIGRIPGQQDVANLVRLEEVAQGGISLAVEDHDV